MQAIMSDLRQYQKTNTEGDKKSQESCSVKLQMLFERQQKKIETEKEIEKETSNQIQIKQNKKNLQRAKLVKVSFVFEPKKFIPVQTNYLLKNCEVVLESMIQKKIQQSYNETSYDWCNSDSSTEIIRQVEVEEKIDVQKTVNQFKYIDYILHENQKNDKVEYLNIRFQEHKQSSVPVEYIIERFNSFGNQIFRNAVKQIEQVELLYQQFLNSKYNIIQGECFKNNSYLQHVQEKNNEIFEQFKGKCVRINNFRAGVNNKICDLVAQCFNKELIELLGYTIEQFLHQCTSQMGIPSFQYLDDAEKYFLTRKQYVNFLIDKTIPKNRIIFPHGSFFLVTKQNEQIYNIQAEVKLFNDGLNQYIAYIFEKV